MRTTEYKITGMTCGHCVQAVTEEVSALDGVSDVTVQLDGGRMTVASERAIEFDRLAEAVDEAGDYGVTPA